MNAVRSGPRRPSRAPRVIVALAIWWVVAVAVALLFVPTRTEETDTSTSRSDVVTVSRTTRPTFSVAPAIELAAVAMAVLATVALVLWARRPGGIPRRAVLVAGGVSAAFCLVSGFSIGMFLLPVPILFVVSAAIAPHR